MGGAFILKGGLICCLVGLRECSGVKDVENLGLDFQNLRIPKVSRDIGVFRIKPRLEQAFVRVSTAGRILVSWHRTATLGR